MGSSSILGPIKPSNTKNPLSIVQKVVREGILKQSTGAPMFQEAVVVEIDPIGGMFSDPTIPVGNPKFSIRARLLSQNGEGVNSDSLRDTEDLLVCFPFMSNYHNQFPIKIGEKLWTFDGIGINGATQRYWISRSPSPSPLDLSEGARPNNNYSNASFEANMFRPSEEQIYDVNTDAKRSNIIQRLAETNEEFANTEEQSNRGRTYYSNVVDRTAERFGFVNEAFPELFSRPSDYILQGSNNNAFILGTNITTIESEDEELDIADIISMFGFSNDASGFTNQKDSSVNVSERAPISALAEQKTAFADMVVGRKYNLLSYNFDASRNTVFESIEIDNIFPGLADSITGLGGVLSEKGPASLIRTNNIRMLPRNSFSLLVGNTSGLYSDIENGGKLLSKFDFKTTFATNNVILNMEQDKFDLSVGSKGNINVGSDIYIDSFNGSLLMSANSTIEMNNIGSSLIISSTGLSLVGPGTISLSAPSLSLGPGGAGLSISSSGMICSLPTVSFNSSGTGVLTNATATAALGSALASIQAAIASISSPTPITGAQAATALQTILAAFNQLLSTSAYTTNFKV